MRVCFHHQAKNAVLDCEETLVGSYRSIEVPLVNNSPCPVSFRLSVQQILLDKEVVHDPETEPSGITPLRFSLWSILGTCMVFNGSLTCVFDLSIFICYSWTSVTLNTLRSVWSCLILALQLHCDKGTIASHSTMLIWSTFKPYRRTQYLWKISYQTLNANGTVDENTIY